MVTFFLIIQLAILIFSIVIHEVSHGEVAYALGDDTAKNMGRLTLNPIKHIDPLGSIIIPLLTFISHAGIIIGWAKPVPYNPANLRNQKYGPTLVGLAGPATNLSIAVFFGIIARLMPIAGTLKQQINAAVAGSVLTLNYTDVLTLINGSALNAFFAMALFITLINVFLAVFNLIPIPPLDGSKILYMILPPSMQGFMDMLERFGFILILLVILFGGSIFITALFHVYSFIVGPGIF